MGIKLNEAGRVVLPPLTWTMMGVATELPFGLKLNDRDVAPGADVRVGGRFMSGLEEFSTRVNPVGAEGPLNVAVIVTCEPPVPKLGVN